MLGVNHIIFPRHFTSVHSPVILADLRRTRMPVKVVDAILSDVNADKLQNNKPTFILLLAATSLSLLASVCLNGTWLDIWVDHKFIHYEDGIVDKSITLFITWFIRILATFLILHCSLDPLLAIGVLICGMMASSQLIKILKAHVEFIQIFEVNLHD